MNESPRLVPPRISAAARGLGRWPGAFGSRFFLALIIGLVWLYMLVWMLVLDLMKLALYRRIAHGEHRHPHWYARFLKGRSTAHSLAAAGSVGQ